MTPTFFASAGRATLALAIYAILCGLMVIGSVRLLGNLWSASGEVAAAQAERDVLARHSVRGTAGVVTPDGQTKGSPFLNAKTITIAGAALQQRVQEAIERAGGVLLSSQVDFDGPDGDKGSVHLAATTEASEPAVQAILYDLEAGMPYLFVDRLSIQPSKGSGDSGGGKMRMTFGVAGQWSP